MKRSWAPVVAFSATTNPVVMARRRMLETTMAISSSMSVKPSSGVLVSRDISCRS
jgi:hypothetical protein